MTIPQYLSWFDEVVAPTEPMFRLVPADKLDWKLTPSSFTLGQQLSHMPRALWFNTRVLISDELPLKSMREILVANRRQSSSTVEEAVDQFHKTAVGFRLAVQQRGEEAFQNHVLDTPQKGKMACWHFALFVVEHHIHHLMELHLNLKVLGVPVDTGTLYRG